MMEGQTGVPRWSAAQKREVVQRVARGEALEAVSRHVRVPVREVERWPQINLLASLAQSYERRHYIVSAPHLEDYEDVPREWQAVKPDLLVKRHGRWQTYFFETASSLREAATPHRWHSCPEAAAVNEAASIAGPLLDVSSHRDARSCRTRSSQRSQQGAEVGAPVAMAGKVGGRDWREGS